LPNDPTGKCIGVYYPDNDDQEFMSQEEFNAHASETSIGVGHVRFRFIKKIEGAGYISGRVLRIMKNKKCMCEFSEDRMQHPYTVAIAKKNQSCK